MEIVLMKWSKDSASAERKEPINPIFSSQFVFLALKENKWKKSGLMASGAPNSFFNPQSIKLLLHLSSFIS